MTQPDARPRGGLLLVVVGAALWGSDALLRAPLAAAYPVAAIALADNLLLALLAAPVVARAWRSFARLPLRVWLALLGIGWGSAGLGTLLLTAAYRHGNPTTALLILSAQPLFAAALAVPLLCERPPARFWPCAGAALAGSYLLAFGTMPPAVVLASAGMIGAVCALGTAALYGSSTVLGRFVLADLAPAALAGAYSLLATPLLAALALSQGVLGGTRVALAEHPLRVAALALLSGLAGMLLYYRGLQRVRSAEAALDELACPVAALLLDRAAMGATIAPAQLAGCAVVWLALAALIRPPLARWPATLRPPITRPRRRAAAPPHAVVVDRAPN